MSILDSVLDVTATGNVRSINNDLGSINVAKGLGDVFETLKISGLISDWAAVREIQRAIDDGDQRTLAAIMAKYPAEFELARQAALKRANLAVSSDGRILTVISEASGGSAWHEVGMLTAQDFTADELKAVWQHTFDLVNCRDSRGNVINDLRYVEVVQGDQRHAIDGVGVGKKFALSQPHELIDQAADIVGSVHGARFASAAVLDDFRKSFICAEMPEVLEPIRGDKTHHWVMLVDRIDGTGAKSLYSCSNRAVCDNTCRLGERRGSKLFSNRHTTNHAQRDADYSAEIDALRGGWKRLVEAAPAMVSTPASVRPFAKNVLDEVLGVTECQHDLSKLLEKSIGETAQTETVRKLMSKREKKVDGALDLILDIAESETNTARGRVWGAYQSVTQYANHVVAKKSDRKFAQIIDGKADEINSLALSQAIAMVS